MKDVLFVVAFVVAAAAVGFVAAAFIATRRFWLNQTMVREEYRHADDDYVLLLRPLLRRVLYDGEVPWTDGSCEGDLKTAPQSAVIRLADAAGIIGVPVMVGPVRLQVAEPAVEAIQAWCPEDSWFDLFVQLGAGARIILMFPDTSAGLLDELEHIRGNRQLLEKTVFLVPPAPREPSRWSAIVETLASVGVANPETLTEGAACMASRESLNETVIPFGGEFTDRVILRALEILGANVRATGVPVSRAISLIEGVERLGGIVGWYVSRTKRRLRAGPREG